MYSVWNSVLSWVLFCLFSSITMEDTRPIVIEEPTTTTTTTNQEGSCVTIKCKYKYQKELKLLWIKDPKWIEKEKRYDGIIVYSNTDERPQVAEYSNRVEFFNDQSSQWTNCTIKIQDLKKNDSGNYTFRYIGSDKYISNTFLLTVVGESYELCYLILNSVLILNELDYNPSILLIYIVDNPCKVHIKPANLNKSLKEGDRVSLQCATSAACEFHPLWQSSGSSEILKSEQSKDEVEKRSELHLTVNWTDDGRTLTCRPSRSNDNCLERRVTLRVEYAPKETKVIESSSSKDVKEGEQVTISCSSKARPNANFTWIKHQSSFSRHGQNLTLYNMKPEDEGKFYCLANNEHGSEKSNDIKIKVIYAPKGVDIDPKLAELKEGDRLTLTCLVQNSNPEVDMQSYRWYKDGQEINQQTMNTFTVPSVRQRDKGVYQCQARNSVGETMSTHITQVSVKYTPQNTFIDGTSGIKLGFELNLKCVTEAEPVPHTYSWYFKPEHEQQFVTLSHTDEMYRIEKVAVSNAGLYKCSAQNDVGKGANSTEKNVLVFYAPKGVDINPKLAELKEGDRLTLTCLVQNSNPEVDMQSYRWYKDGQEINQQTMNTFTVPSVRQRDKGVYQCQARNSVGETMSTNITQVSVKYHPQNTFIDGTSGIKLGFELNLKCVTEAEPVPHKYSWYFKPEHEQQFVTLSHTDEMYRIEKVAVSNAGLYKCSAQNDVGKGANSTEKNVFVFYPPKTPNLTMKEVVKEEELYTITCTVESSPQANLTLSRSSLTNPEKDIITVQYVQSNILKFAANATVSDAGMYTCEAENTEGKNFSKNQLKVLYAPKGVDINPKLAELKEGDRLTLTCLVQNSNPEVDMQSYRWYKDGQEINQQTMNTFTVPSVRQRDKGVYQCQARNSVGETMSTNITQVSVKYHPQNTFIDGRSGIKLGFELNLKCVTEADPLPHTYSWYFKPEHEQQFVTLSHTDEMYRIEKVAVSNAGLYKCSAQNDVGKGANSTEKNVFVFYPPKTPNLTMKDVVKEEELYTITCTVESSPQATLTLSRSSLTNPEKDIITVQYVQSNILKFAANATVSDAGMYTCEAENTEGKTFSKNQLKVLYAPKNVTALADPGVELKEGSNLTLTCKADSVPEVSAYTWKKSSATHSETVGHGQKITLHFLKSSDSDHYFCISRNEIGSVKSSSIYIRVKYQPRITLIHNMTSLGLWEKAVPIHLSCNVQCDPPATFFAWYKMEENTTVLSNNLNYTVEPQNPGTYYCYARNEEGESRSEPVKIFLNHFIIKQLVQVIISLLVIVFLIGVMFLIRRIILRKRSAQRSFFFSAAPLCFLSNLGSSDSCNNTRENLVIEGSTELSSFRDNHSVSAVQSNPPANRNIQAGRPNSNILSKQKQHHTEEDLTMTTVNYAMLQFMDNNNPNKSVPSHDSSGPVYADVSKNKQMAKKPQDGHEHYENVSGVCCEAAISKHKLDLGQQ
ncbi:sialoadhesin isoform X1 [Ictalurus punctatus]|uniref:B-cell receptor CD22 n=1 Tax=Ictalurus punctatus TaxID=7998 RepID=A0A9F7RIG0_ICTPU|nr:sialoadhesin isoform X1 [Ictalurus punctatus]XP_053543549.1 sialoadhesin isoform X1 [Ictalurus punctatus]